MTLKEKIIEAKNIIGEKAAHIIAEDLKLDKWDSKALKACCPFHSEDTPSFIWNKKENYFKCFGCGRVYSILDHYQHHQGLSYIDAVKKLFNEANIEFNDFSFKSQDKEDYFKNYKYPKEETNTDRTKVEEYLAKRHISKETLDFVGIKQDVYGNIVFEHRDVDGKLLCVKYRPSRPVRKGEDKMWWQKKASTCPILYGVNQIDITKPLLIVEGHIDRLSCIEAGFTNVVSIPHGAENLSWIEFNWEWLDNFDTIILWYDNDTVGQTALKNVIVRLGEHRCKIVEPDEVVIDKVREYYKQFNKNLNIEKTDANNVLLACGKQEVLNLINNAKEVPIPDVVDIMDCDDVDIQNIPKIPTGFSELDKLIYGQIEGTLNIWSGYTGHGKTVVVAQSAIIESVESGHKVFVFSGELEGGQLKNWLLKPWAGEKHTIEWDNGANKPKGYTVTVEAREFIKDYYKNKVFFYDTYLNTKPEAILNRMEYMFKKYGVDVFVLDNLMCIDFSDYADEWSAQKKFILDLLKFTVRHKAYTHLVAHPKKGNDKTNIDAYLLYGTSNLANLTHRLFWVSRNTKQDDIHDSEIIILKDRPTGVSNGKVKLYYNRETMRLISNEEDKKKTYSWEQNANIKYPKHIEEKLVFNLNKEAEREVFG